MGDGGWRKTLACSPFILIRYGFLTGASGGKCRLWHPPSPKSHPPAQRPRLADRTDRTIAGRDGNVSGWRAAISSSRNDPPVCRGEAEGERRGRGGGGRAGAPRPPHPRRAPGPPT